MKSSKAQKQASESLSLTDDLKDFVLIFGEHDKNGLIWCQICEFLQKDGVSLNDLCYFDDLSISEIIDSWNINTFGVKKCIIRGLFVKFIKKRKYNCNMSDESFLKHEKEIILNLIN